MTASLSLIVKSFYSPICSNTNEADYCGLFPATIVSIGIVPDKIRYVLDTLFHDSLNHSLYGDTVNKKLIRIVKIFTTGYWQNIPIIV
jgi:hypothetical protein